MVKKQVPDWLNSSMWSSPPSNSKEDHHSKSSSVNSYDSSPVIEPPVPTPKPPDVSGSDGRVARTVPKRAALTDVFENVLSKRSFE
ncbi:hypothetical protein L1987_00284 [Smallanthus sonchifolius]|uniref:Uncharacterized protein n=1 Tax=Smallanthus sonchifolius TaxID=185202 RepID=A0ACB9K1U5_9ASTR|nr:hypothetical protein L1987_00284 [Smallanthus sonchifolius]